MRTRKFRAGLAMLILAWATPCSAQALVRADRPAVKVGDSTVYRDFDVRTGEKRDTTFVLTDISAGRIVTKTSGSTSGERTFTRDWNPVETRTGEFVTFSAKPFQPWLQFPLEVGRTWNIPFVVEVAARPVNRNAQWQWQARVVAVEAVTVPAGTFQAFRIECAASFTTRQGSDSWTGAHNETVWFAPAVQRIVKRDFEQSVPSKNNLEHHIIELLSFKPAP